MSKVITVRVNDDLYDKLVSESLARGCKNLSEYLQISLATLANKGLNISTAPITKVKQEASEIDVFFTLQSTSGPPKVCPRCGSKAYSPTISYNANNGGTWSCTVCHAHGRWYDNQPSEVVYLGFDMSKSLREEDKHNREEMDKLDVR